MRKLKQNHKNTAREMGAAYGSKELLAYLAAEQFHEETNLRSTNKVEYDMAYFLGFKEALQEFAKLLEESNKTE